MTFPFVFEESNSLSLVGIELMMRATGQEPLDQWRQAAASNTSITKRAQMA